MAIFDHEGVKMPWVTGLCPCLRVPVAARDMAAIEAHVGSIVREVPDASGAPSFLVSVARMVDLDHTLPVWGLDAAAIFWAGTQLWVHVDTRTYRRRFAGAFPNLDIRRKDINHALNRDVARLKGFNYVRLVAISRTASRSGAEFSDRSAIEYHSSEQMQQHHRLSKAQVQFTDLAKMLGIAVGGGVMGPLNDVQYLFRPKETSYSKDDGGQT